MKPNTIGKHIKEDFIENSYINIYGLRDKEIDEYSRYYRRIIVLGDSFTYGYGVNNGQTYSDFLESLFLSKSGKKVDVINAGVPGYGTDQEYKFYKTMLYDKLKHDILILGIYYNDIDDNISVSLYNIIDKDKLQPLNATKNWIYFLTNIWFKAPQIIQKSHLFNFILSRLKNKDIFFLLPDMSKEELREWSKRKIMLEIEALDKMTKAKNITFAVVVMPIKNPPEKAYNWIRKKMSDRDILFIDVAKYPVWDKKRAKLFFKKDSHLTSYGNIILARQIYQGIKDLID